MKSESEVFHMITNFIQRDANISAAVLNGSRANPNAPQDLMQDFDIAFYVSSLEEAQKYKADRSWINDFGDLVMLQQNEYMGNAFIFLIQYFYGLRLDLSFHDAKNLVSNLAEDSLSIVIYDRDNVAGDVPSSNEFSYYVQRPTREKWDETLNELWWLQIYIAKELWRGEMPLVKELYDNILMACLRDLLSWHIAADNDWQVNVGHGGKWLGRLLPQALYEEFLYFYSSADEAEQWEKLLRIGEFIRGIAQPLSIRLGYEYPLRYDNNVSEYIRKIHGLSPKDHKNLKEEKLNDI